MNREPGCEPFDWATDSPSNVRCAKCREQGIAATRAFQRLCTGVIEHLYYCHKCKWGTTIRYLPGPKKHQYLAVNVVSPGRTAFGFLLPGKAPKRRK